MASFKYKALDSSGSIVTGELTAGDRGEALRQLDRKKLQPVSLNMDSGGAGPKEKGSATKPAAPGRAAAPGKPVVADEEIPDGPVKLKRADVVLFTEELSDMLSAGLQLEPALRAMENRQELGGLKAVSTKIRQLVRDGNSFSSSLKRVSPSFGPLYCSLAAAGEASGALDTILDRQAHYLKTLQELQGKVILAMIYPAFLIMAGIGVGIVFVTKLIPQLVGLLESTPGSKIPLGAQIMMGASNFFGKWWLVIALVLGAGAILFKAWKDNEENRPTWDRVKLKLPLFGAVIERRFYVQFLETMANLVGNGLPLLRALELTRDATQNLFIRSHLTEMVEWVGDGRSLSASMMRSGVFSPLLIDMVTVGEQTGKIDIALRKAGVRFDKELNNALQRIMALIMPAVLLVMALLIGSMAYLMITAIFQTIQSIGGK
ncbi:type II secretion system F family protein [Akkermansiaceae bacterium]|nr:type II secretion system F family protein [Akkermansiaceae bacterium]